MKAPKLNIQNGTVYLKNDQGIEGYNGSHITILKSSVKITHPGCDCENLFIFVW